MAVKACVSVEVIVMGMIQNNVYIISGSKGYRLTTDKDEVMQSIEKEERLAKIRFKQAHRRRRRAENFFTKNERLPI